ncbi:MAG: hypothetical protein R3F02_22095 [Thiolinea sp.]
MPYHYYRPKDKIARFSEYFDLLETLFRFPQGYTEDVLRYQIDQTKGSSAPETSYIFDSLLNYGLIVESTDFQPRYVLGVPYRALLEQLYQESQPVNSAVIQGYITALANCAGNLQKAYEAQSTPLTLKHLQHLSREMESISQTSRNNRLGVINEVRKLRLNDEKLSYRERLAEANRLWDEYLEPLREIIAPTGTFGQAMQHLKQVLDNGEALFNANVELRHQFTHNRVLRVQLQEQARIDLSEASLELDPLREKLLEESRLLEASSLVFDYLEQGKLTELPTLSLGRKLTHERQIDLYGLIPWLAELWSIQNEPDSFSFEEQEEVEPDPLETEALLQLLADMPADTDLIEYFQKCYNNLSANAVLRAISIATLHQTDVPIGVSADESQYWIDGQLWKGSGFYKITDNNKGQ